MESERSYKQIRRKIYRFGDLDGVNDESVPRIRQKNHKTGVRPNGAERPDASTSSATFAVDVFLSHPIVIILHRTTMTAHGMSQRRAAREKMSTVE